VRLQAEVRAQRPQGGRIPRQIEQALQACGSKRLQARTIQPERRPGATAAN
jgi:serine/threonine-protein kinase